MGRWCSPLSLPHGLEGRRASASCFCIKPIGKKPFWLPEQLSTTVTQIPFHRSLGILVRALLALAGILLLTGALTLRVWSWVVSPL